MTISGARNHHSVMFSGTRNCHFGKISGPRKIEEEFRKLDNRAVIMNMTKVSCLFGTLDLQYTCDKGVGVVQIKRCTNRFSELKPIGIMRTLKHEILIST